MVKYVFFDLGLTLVENQMPQHYMEALNFCGFHITRQMAARIYHLANKYFMRERQGELGKGNRQCFEDYVTLVCEIAGNKEKAPLVINALDKMNRPVWRSFSFTFPVLETLKANGIGTGLISNWDLNCRQVLKENGLYDYLNPIIVSSEEQVEKPEQRIFEIALEKAGVKPEECIYVGDNYYDDAVGSAKLGIKCYIINPADYLGIEEIKGTDTEIIADIREVLDKLGFSRN